MIMGRLKKVMFLGGKTAVTGVGKNIDRIFRMSGLLSDRREVCHTAGGGGKSVRGQKLLRSRNGSVRQEDQL